MADTIQNQILEDIHTTLDAVTSLATVADGTFELYKVERPAAGVIPDEEITDDISHDRGIYEEKLRVAIRVVVDEGAASARKTLGEIGGDVHRAMIADPTRGGLAADTLKIGTKWLFLDEHFPRAGFDMSFLITYATDAKDPSVNAID